MNLLEEKWLPVRRTNGRIDWVAPHQITDPDIVAFSANRADFNGALAQFMIGLLQTTTTIVDEGEWDDIQQLPPTSAVLQSWFAPFAHAFVLDGDGARFMQDYSLRVEDGGISEIDALLIDSAGGSAVDKNTDHFVKRRTITKMCPHCAATALFTLQTNAPAGGAGNRTSLRGGGPLTTLFISTPSRGLWADLWLNVEPRQDSLLHGGDIKKTDVHFMFPWLADIEKIQASGGETHPLHVHPHHVFWGMPRRIRLDFSGSDEGQCDVCKRDALQLIYQYSAKPHGLNYKGAWRHPFSPYYQDNKEGLLPVHPQPGGFGYKHWLSWVLDRTQNKKQVQAATVVSYVLSTKRKNAHGCRLWVFGYDMDNMKPRCWYESTYPLYNLTGTSRSAKENVQNIVGNLIEAAEYAVFFLRQAVKDAWFGSSDLRGDLSFIDKVFWSRTESAFYQQLNAVIEQARSETGIDLDDVAYVIGIGESWLNVLRVTALHLFDADIVGVGSISHLNPHRLAQAYQRLRMNFGGKEIKKILRLPIAESADKSGNKKKTTKAVKIITATSVVPNELQQNQLPL